MRRKIVLGSVIAVIVLVLCAFCACSLLFSKGTGKAELTSEMIRCSEIGETTSFVYTGEPIELGESFITIIVDGEFVSNDYFEFQYKDNVDVGVATLVVTAKEDNPYATGSAELHFTIVADGSKQCEATDDLAAMLDDPGITGVQVWSDRGIAEGETLTVPEGKTLYLHYGYILRNHGTIINHGTIVMRGAQLSTGGRRATELINYGSIVNHGTLEIKEYAVLEDNGTFTSDGEVTNLGTVYLKDEDKAFLTDGQGGAHYVRTPAEMKDFSVAECVYKQGVSACTPAVSALRNGVAFTVTYSDNQAAGTGQATVLLEDRDRFYYGSVTIPFLIKRGQATADSFEGLKELISSENYDHYGISSLEVPTEESLTLPGGQTLTVSSRLSVSGTFISEGDVTCGKFIVEKGAVVTSDAMLTVTGNTFSVSGTFINGEHGDWSFDVKKGAMAVSGTFINRGSVMNKSFSRMLGTLENTGTLQADTFGMRGFFVNRGTATFGGVTIVAKFFTDQLGLDGYSTFRNEEGGHVTVTGDAYFDGAFVNDGTFVNQGRVSFADGIDYSAEGTFDNTDGEVFLFAPLAGIGDRVNRRRYLTDPETKLLAEYLETPYNKVDQRPAATVDGIPVSELDATVRYRYTGAEKDADACIKVGEITVRITMRIDSYFSLYAGSRDFTYRIIPATVHVTNATFYTALIDDGYDTVVLDEDVRFASGYTRVVTHCTLDLNGHRLTLGTSNTNRGSIHSFGKLIGGAAVDLGTFVPSEEAACMVIESGSGFYNYGRVENNGFIYSKGENGFCGNYHDTGSDVTGVVLNHGVIYASQNCVVTETSTGVVYKRTDIADLGRSISVPSVKYTGSELTPEPSLVYLGDPVDMSRFALTYSSNVDVGMGRLQIAAADPFDTDFYGTTRVEFSIGLGTAEVKTESEFISAAENVNFERVTLLANITLHSAVTAATKTGKVVDLDVYEIFFEGDGKLTFDSLAKIELKAGTEARFKKYFYGAYIITLTADIGEVGSPVVLDFKGYTLENITGGWYELTYVNTDGHSFPGGLTVSNGNIKGGRYYFRNTSETESCIGNAVGGYALEYQTCTKETELFFDKITIYGVNMSGGFNTAQYVSLSASDCRIMAATDVHKACAFNVRSTMSAVGEFVRCTFEGANAFRANQGTFTFYDCTLHSYDAYSDKYSDHYGDALYLEYSGRHGMTVEVQRCTFLSENGNGIHLLNRNSAVRLTVDDDSTFSHPEERQDVVG